MLGQNNKRKILFVVDLDFTHFNTKKSDIVWLGSQTFWANLYHELECLLKSHHIDMRFAVVTNKDKFDDLCEEAAITFRPYLSLGQPEMYVSHNQHTYCLAHIDGEKRYECLTSDHSIPCANPNVVPHFVVVPSKSKMPYIQNIAQHLGIPLHECVLLDDTPQVLQPAQEQGVKTIRFDAFCPDCIDINKLDDKEYVWDILNTKKLEIMQTINHMINPIPLAPIPHQVVAPSDALSLGPNYLSQFTLAQNTPQIKPEIIDSDPLDCLHSWYSRLRLFGN